MIQQILLGLTIFLIWVYYTYWYKPKKFISWYQKTYEQLGYKVKVIPFKGLDMSHRKIWKQKQKFNNDSYYMEKNECKQTDLIISNVMDSILITFLHPDLIKEIYSPDKIYIYQKLPKLIQGFREIGGNGLSLSQGDVWKAKRKVLSTIFNWNLIANNIDVIATICDTSIQEFQDESAAKYPDDAKNNIFRYPLVDLAIRIFNGVMLKCFLGIDPNKEKVDGVDFNNFVSNLFTQAGYISFSPLIILFGKYPYQMGATKNIRQFKKKLQIYKSIVTEIIENKKVELQRSPPTSQYKSLIEALYYFNSKEDKCFQYTTQGLIEELGTFLLGGTDTTAHFLSMMMFYINDNPEIERKIRREMHDHIISNNSNYNIENLKKLNYLNWAQFQTTRLYGPGFTILARNSLQDHNVGPLPVLKGTVVTVNHLANHYNEKYFKNPKQFIPERWDQEVQSFAFGGFAGGPRNCIGKQLAYLQSKILTVKILERYKSYKVPGDANRAMNLTFYYAPDKKQTIFYRC